MYYVTADGKRRYTLKVSPPRLGARHRARPRTDAPPQKTDPEGRPTESAHPARFSPDDPYSKQRVSIKRRFGLIESTAAKKAAMSNASQQ